MGKAALPVAANSNAEQVRRPNRRWVRWALTAALLGGQFAMTQKPGELGRGWIGQAADDARYALDHFAFR